MPKPFITYQQQIALLKSKHLTVPDEMEAERVLADIGYFTLIGGYKHPFKNKSTKLYRDGVTFDDIVKLYEFDESLRRQPVGLITALSHSGDPLIISQ